MFPPITTTSSNRSKNRLSKHFDIDKSATLRENGKTATKTLKWDFLVSNEAIDNYLSNSVPNLHNVDLREKTDQYDNLIDANLSVQDSSNKLLNSLRIKLSSLESKRLINPPSFVTPMQTVKISSDHHHFSQTMPTMSLLSPRTQSKIALLPAPSADDECKIAKYLQFRELPEKLDSHEQLKSSISRLLVEDKPTTSRPHSGKVDNTTTPIPSCSKQPVFTQDSPPEVDFMPIFKERVYDELGINLDAGFILQLKAKRFLDRMQYSLITFPLTECLSIWKHVTHILKERMRDKAARRIQIFVKRVLRIMQCRWRMRLIIDKRKAEKKVEYELFVTKTRAVTVIQSRWRCYQCMKSYKDKLIRIKSANMIVSWIQSNTSLLWLKCFRKFFIAINIAACKIQTHYRRHAAQKKRKLLVKIKQSDALVDLKILVSGKRRLHIATIGASCRIQSMYRNHALRLNMRNLIQVNREMKASLIQTWFRNCRCRRLYALQVRQREARKKFLADNATKIQSIWRRKLAFLIFHELTYTKRLNIQVSIKYAKIVTSNIDLAQKIKSSIVSVGRFIMPCRGRWEYNHAVSIQRIWRGHRGKRRFKYLKLIDHVNQKSSKQSLMIKSTIKIQAMYRCHVVKAEVKRIKMMKYSSIITSIFFICHARRKLFKLKNRTRASIVIQKYYRSYVIRKGFKKLMKFSKLHNKDIRIVGRFLKNASNRRRRCQCRALNRIKAESVSICHYKLAETFVQFNVKQITQEMKVALNEEEPDDLKRLMKKLKKKKKKGDQKSGILSDMLKNKSMTVSDLYKLLVDIPGLIKQPKVKSGSISPYLTSLISDRSLMLLSKNNIDVVFSRHKSSSSSLISLQQFSEMIRDIATLLLPKLKAFDIHHDDFGSSQDQKPADCLAFLLMRLVLGLDTDIHSWIRYYLFPSSDSSSSWLAEVREKNKRRVYQEMDNFAAKLQSAYRSHVAFKEIEKKKQEEARLKMKRKQEITIIHVQALIRRFISRRRLMKLSRGAIVQYYPPNKLAYKCLGVGQSKSSLSTWKPYWFNTTTNQSTNACLIKNSACRTVYLPLPEYEFVVSCSNCRKSATMVCTDCETCYCKNCFEAVHKRQLWTRHGGMNIPMCSVCRYQAASMHCESCTIDHHRKFKTYSKMLFCDTCYSTHHFPPHNNSGLSKKMLVDLSQHKATRLVALCQLCSSFSSRWRCDACKIAFCTSCMDKTHSEKVNHKLQFIAYYTIEMVKRFDVEYRLNQEAMEIDRLMPAIREILMIRNVKAATRIQSWYRGVKGRIEGLNYIKSRLHDDRVIWRNHNRDNILIRSKLWYKMIDSIGMAPKLKSDSKEEVVLKNLVVWNRWEARRLISSNVSVVTKIKGKPKVGFNSGNVEELIDQARRGGVRLPGYGMIKLQDGAVYTSVDLRLLLENGDTIRLMDQYFTVMQVSSKQVAIDMRWSGGKDMSGKMKKKRKKRKNDDDLSMIRRNLRNEMRIEEEDEGEEDLVVIYKMILSISQSIKWTMQQSVRDNVMTQSCVQLYVNALSRLDGSASANAEKTKKKKKKSALQIKLTDMRNRALVLLLTERPSGKATVGELKSSEIVQREINIWDDSDKKKNNENIHQTPQQKLALASQGYENWEEGYDDTNKCPTWTDVATHVVVTAMPDCVRARKELVVLEAEKAEKARDSKAKLETMKKRTVSKKFSRI